ncbi:hypothetical protein D3C71_1374880 [compost metagenome]
MQRQELTGDPGIVAGVLREEGQVRVVVDVPGQARRDVVAFVVGMVDRHAAVANHAVDAVQELTFVIEFAGAVEVDLLAVVAADFGTHFVAGNGIGATADHVEHATRRGLAIYRRGWTAQQGDALQIPGFNFRVGVGSLWQRQAIEKLSRFEATYAQPVGARIAAVAARDHARHVTYGVIEVLNAAIFHLRSGDYRHRTRCFDDRCVGLGASSGASGNIAFHRAPGIFDVFSANHASGRQGHRTFRHWGKAERACAALFQLQTGAAQGFTQGASAVELAVDRCRSLARSQCWIQRQRQTGLAGDLVQGAGQWRGRQVVGTNAGRLFSGDQLAAHQRGAKGNGNRQQTGAQQGV